MSQVANGGGLSPNAHPRGGEEEEAAAELLLGLGTEQHASESQENGPQGTKRHRAEPEPLTDKGATRIANNDTRVRLSKEYANVFAPDKIPEFRLASTKAAAHAEDCVMVWAHVTEDTSRNIPFQRHLFRYDPFFYLNDTELVESLKKLTNAASLVEFLKARYKTKQQGRPKRQKTSPKEGPKSPPEPSVEAFTGDLRDPVVAKIDCAATEDVHAVVSSFPEPGTDGKNEMEVDAAPSQIISRKLDGKALDNMAVEDPRSIYPRWLDGHGTKVDEHGEKVVHAAQNGKCASLLELLQTWPPTISSQREQFETKTVALLKAVERGHTDCVQALLQNDFIKEANKNGETVFHKAAAQGHAACVKLLLDAGADVAVLDNQKQTALHAAAAGGHAACMQSLLGAKADVAVLNCDGETALHAAAAGGHTACVKLLLDAKADVAVLNNQKQTALHAAAAGGHEACVNILLDNGADIKSSKELYGSALHRAAQGGHVDCLKTMLEHGADVNLCAILYERKYTKQGMALHIAAMNGHAQCVGMLLKAGANIDCLDAAGLTPLYFTMKGGHKDCAMALLSAGADVNLPDYEGNTALHAASRQGDLEFLRLLLERGADVNARNHFNKTPLHLAAAKGRAASITALVAAGADVNLVDHLGRTPLHDAAEGFYAECVEALVKGGADTAARTKFGKTAADLIKETASNSDIIGRKVKRKKDVEWALRIAANNGQLAFLNLLLEAGANVDCLDQLGRTSLFLAVQEGHRDCAMALLSAGADVNLQSLQGRTALHAACHNGDLGFLRLLLEAGADVNLSDNESYTALHAACHNGDLEFLRLLLEREALVKGGADTAARTKFGKTAADLVKETASNIIRSDRYRPGLKDKEDVERTLGSILALLGDANVSSHPPTKGNDSTNVTSTALADPKAPGDAAATDILALPSSDAVPPDVSLPKALHSALDGTSLPLTAGAGTGIAPSSDVAPSLPPTTILAESSVIPSKPSSLDTHTMIDGSTAAPSTTAAVATTATTTAPQSIAPTALPGPAPSQSAEIKPEYVRILSGLDARALYSAFPITTEAEGVKADGEALAIVKKAAAGEQLETLEAFYLLNNAEKLDLPHSMEPGKQPPAGSLFLFNKSRCPIFKKDGHPFNRESHSTLRVEGQARIKVYYGTLPDITLQRRSYFDNLNPEMVLVHYLRPPANTRAAPGINRATANPTAAAAAATTTTTAQPAAAATTAVPAAAAAVQTALPAAPVLSRHPSGIPISPPVGTSVATQGPIETQQPTSNLTIQANTAAVGERQSTEVKNGPEPEAAPEPATTAATTAAPPKPPALARLLSERNQIYTPPQRKDTWTPSPQKAVPNEDEEQQPVCEGYVPVAPQYDEEEQEAPAVPSNAVPSEQEDVEMPDAAPEPQPPTLSVISHETLKPEEAPPPSAHIGDQRTEGPQPDAESEGKLVSDIPTDVNQSEKELLKPQESGLWNLMSPWKRQRENLPQPEARHFRALVAIGVHLELPLADIGVCVKAVNMSCDRIDSQSSSFTSFLESAKEPLTIKSLQSDTMTLLGLKWHKIHSSDKEKWEALVNRFSEQSKFIFGCVADAKEVLVDEVMEELQSAQTDNRNGMGKALKGLYLAGVIVGTSLMDLASFILDYKTPLDWAATYYEFIRDALVANEVDQAKSLVLQALENKPMSQEEFTVKKE